jgi:hypothetical protein
VVWTPEEMAEIGRAVQKFQAALPGGGRHDFVSLDDIGVISPARPEPREDPEIKQWLGDHPDHRLIQP